MPHFITDTCTGCTICVRDCPWETIKMVPTPTVEGHKSSIDSQPTKDHPIFEKPQLVPEEIRTFVAK